MASMKFHDELRIAILKQAVRDYGKALKKRDLHDISYFEKWFLGSWCALLSNDKGQQILDECNARYEAKKRNNIHKGRGK